MSKKNSHQEIIDKSYSVQDWDEMMTDLRVLQYQEELPSSAKAALSILQQLENLITADCYTEQQKMSFIRRNLLMDDMKIRKSYVSRDETIAQIVRRYTRDFSLDKKEAALIIAGRTPLSRKEVLTIYNKALNLKHFFWDEEMADPCSIETLWNGLAMHIPVSPKDLNSEY